MDFDQKKSQEKNPKGFTLVELIVVMALFGFISTVLMTSLLSVYRFKEVLQAKKQLNFEASSLLNNGLSSMIRSGFAINYDETKIHLPEEVTKGVQEDVDQISIFTDQAETDYFTLYRKPYQSEGELSDTAQLYFRFKTGKEVPLHSSEVVVEDFVVKIPKDPRDSGDSDIQPYVSLYLRFRQRHPSGEIPTESQLKDSEPILASYSTTLTLRNTSPASYKNPISDPSFPEMMKFNPVL